MVESVEDFDISTFVPGQIARKQYNSVYTSTYSVIKGYMSRFDSIKLTITKARGITDQIATIQTEIESFFSLYRGYSKYFIAHLKKMD